MEVGRRRHRSLSLKLSPRRAGRSIDVRFVPESSRRLKQGFPGKGISAREGSAMGIDALACVRESSRLLKQRFPNGSISEREGSATGIDALAYFRESSRRLKRGFPDEGVSAREGSAMGIAACVRESSDSATAAANVSH